MQKTKPSSLTKKQSCSAEQGRWETLSSDPRIYRMRNYLTETEIVALEQQFAAREPAEAVVQSGHSGSGLGGSEARKARMSGIQFHEESQDPVVDSLIQR